MTNEGLHKILDDEDKKISLKEFKEIIYDMKRDCDREAYLASAARDIYRMGFYAGEQNAFYLALDLSEHIKDKKEDFKHKFVTQARYDQLSARGLLDDDVMYFIVEVWEEE